MVTAGQRLKEERLTRELTVEEVAKATKIRPAFIRAIEQNDYKRLPSGTYTQGFVRNYAEFLELPIREILALYRRQFDEEKAFHVLPSGLAKQQDMPLKRFRLQQTALIVSTVLIVVALYLLFQYRYLFINPPLTVLTPKEGSILSSTLAVTGTTDANASILVNDEAVTINQDGSFTKTLELFPGKTTITIKAVNRFGKETIMTRTVTVSEE